MQNTVLKPSTVRLWSGVLKVNSVNVGAIDSATFEAIFKIAQLKFKNAKMSPRKKLDEVTLKAEIVELYLPTLNQNFGWELSDILAADNTETWNDRKVLTFDDFIKLIDLYPVEFINTDDTWKIFGIRIFQGYNAWNLAFDFGDDEDLESFSKVPWGVL